MTGLQVGVSNSNRTGKRAFRWVEIRETSEDEWEVAPYIVPATGKRAISPSMNSHQFRYNYGLIARTGFNAFSFEGQYDLKGWQIRVKVRARERGAKANIVFAGIIQDSGFGIHGNQYGSGDQTFTAVGPEYHLDKSPVIRSYWFNSTTLIDFNFDGFGLEFDFTVPGPLELASLDISPTFNRQGSGGEIIGNRSVEKYNGLCYLLDENQEVWSAYDILEYLLVSSPIEGNFTWLMTGEVDVLKSYYPVIDGQHTIWGIINQVVRRTRGMGCRVIWDGSTDIIELRFRPLTDIEYVTENFTVPANTAAIDIDLKTSSLINNLKMNESSYPEYDYIIVRGGKFRVTTTLSGENVENTLVPGWEESAEEEYRLAGDLINGFSGKSPLEQAHYADLNRSSENTRYRRVYQFYKLSDTFDFVLPEVNRTETINDGSQTTAALNLPETVVFPQIGLDGSILYDQRQPLANNWQPFCRHCGIYKDIEYDTLPLASYEGKEVVPALAYALSSSSKELPDGSSVSISRYYDLIDSSLTEFPTATIRPDETQAGVWIMSKPAHLLALNSFDPSSQFANAHPTNQGPITDYKDLQVTIALESNRHVDMVYSLRPTGYRFLVINVPDAELWWIAPRTVYGIDFSGQLKRVTETNGILTRDDRERLRAIMLMAAAWHSKKRVAVGFDNRAIGGVPDVGTLIETVTLASGSVESNTVVTEITINYDADTTTVKTQHIELDFVSGGNSVSGGVTTSMNTQAGKANEQQIRQIPFGQSGGTGALSGGGDRCGGEVISVATWYQ